jgi:hypothetical protein
MKKVVIWPEGGRETAKAAGEVSAWEDTIICSNLRGRIIDIRSNLGMGA